MPWQSAVPRTSAAARYDQVREITMSIGTDTTAGSVGQKLSTTDTLLDTAVLHARRSCQGVNTQQPFVSLDCAVGSKRATTLDPAQVTHMGSATHSVHEPAASRAPDCVASPAVGQLKAAGADLVSQAWPSTATAPQHSHAAAAGTACHGHRRGSSGSPPGMQRLGPLQGAAMTVAVTI